MNPSLATGSWSSRDNRADLRDPSLALEGTPSASGRTALARVNVVAVVPEHTTNVLARSLNPGEFEANVYVVAQMPKSSPGAVALQDQAEVTEFVPEVLGGNRLSVGTHEERLVEEGTQESK